MSAPGAGLMRAARLHGIGDIRLHDEPIPSPKAGEVLLRVGSVGLCGSDLHWWVDGRIGTAQIERPVIPGHEFGGTIASGPEAGLRVVVDPAISCGQCPQCAEGCANLCPSVRFAGHGALDGAMAQYLAWPRSTMVPVPASLTNDDVALLEPLGVAIHGLDLAHLRVGASVAVVGCGPIGLFLIQLARVAGAASVLAVEPLEHRRAAALEYGADAAIAPEELDGRGELNQSRVVFEVSGQPSAVAAAVRLARPGARVVLIGIPDDDRTQFPAGEARRKGLSLVLSRRMGEVYPRAIDLVSRGAVRLSGMVTESFGLDEVADAFRAAASRRGHKVTLRIEEGGGPGSGG